MSPVSGISLFHLGGILKVRFVAHGGICSVGGILDGRQASKHHSELIDK